MRTSNRPAVAGLLLVPLALAGCTAGAGGPSPTSSDEYAVDGTFTMAINEDPGDLNPLLNNLTVGQIVNAFAYDSLVFIDPATSKVEPYLAESWTEEPGKVTFTLKDGITCADGSAFTAQTAADNIAWIVDPANASPQRDAVVPSIATATAEGNVLTVTTSEPTAFLLNNVGTQPLVCDAALKDPKAAASASVGTGLFAVTENVAGDHITLERRDGYAWGPNGETTSDTAGVPRTVTLSIVPDPSTAANLLLSGGLNAAIVSGADEERVAQLPSQESPNLSGMIIFNHLKGKPTQDVAVRRALTQALDPDTFTKIITGGKGERATSMLTLEPKTCVYDSVKGTIPDFDAKAAAQTLEADGWAQGSDGVYEKGGTALSVDLIYNNSTDVRSAAAEYVAKQWQDLGAKVNLDGGDQNYLLGKTFSATDPSGWTASIGVDLMTGTPSILPPYLSGETVPTGLNFASIDNPGYDELAAKAAAETGTAACDLWKQAEVALLGDVDLLPVSVTPYKLYFNGATSLYQPVAGILAGPGVRVLKK